jgi:ribonucleoside-diphosphate reductase beta chain
MGCVLFNHLCDENAGVRTAVRTKVEEAARIAVEMEMNFIDKMFEMGDLENLKADDLKEFIKKRANEKLQELGYEGIFDYDKEKAAELDWFNHLSGGVTHTDFFAIRPTDYSKANEGEDFEAIWD